MGFYIGHFTDCHIAEPHQRFKDIDSAKHVEMIVHQLNHLPRPPQIVVITGDLTHNGEKAEYELLIPLLEKLDMPYFIIPGNHDKRDQFKHAFSYLNYIPQQSEFLHYVIEDYPIRLIGLDTLIPGQGTGEMCNERLNWLDSQLKTNHKPTLLFMHHPPYLSGIEALDIYQLSGQQNFENLLKQHNQIIGILCGDYHRTVHTQMAGIPVCSLGSTTAQILPDFSDIPHSTWLNEAPVFAIHKWSKGLPLASLTFNPTSENEVLK